MTNRQQPVLTIGRGFHKYDQKWGLMYDTVQDFADQINRINAEDGWWAPYRASWMMDPSIPRTRRNETWAGSWGIPVDIDHVLAHAEDRPLTQNEQAHLPALIRLSWGGLCSVAYATPRGLRGCVLLASRVDDLYQRELIWRLVVARWQRSLQTSGLADAGFQVDVGASKDRIKLQWAPKAKGRKGHAVVVGGKYFSYALAQSARAEGISVGRPRRVVHARAASEPRPWDPDLRIRSWCDLRRPGPETDEPATEWMTAAQRFNVWNTPTWPSRPSKCPMCGSPGGFVASDRKPGKWCCFSTRHEGGPGSVADGCYLGDALDFWSSMLPGGKTELLRKTGWLK